MTKDSNISRSKFLSVVIQPRVEANKMKKLNHFNYLNTTSSISIGQYLKTSTKTFS